MAPSSSSSYEKAKEAMVAATSVAASMMLVRSLASELLARALFYDCMSGLRSRLSWRHTVVIESSDGWYTNRVFYAAKTYLAARMDKDAAAVQRVRLSGGGVDDDGDDNRLVVGLEEGEELVDTFQGAAFTWCLYAREPPANNAGKSSSGIDIVGSSNSRGGKLYFELSFHKRHKEKALRAYVTHVIATAKAIRDQERPLTIHMNEGSDWSPTDLHHPSTFHTLAMDRDLKQSVVDDLDKFVKRKAWKRGYLLYGPPGTGKSSLIAAMANHLRFDIYDLELTGVESNSQFRKLLLRMTNRSILVIEDIDCTIDLKQRNKELGDGGDNGDGGKKSPDEPTTTTATTTMRIYQRQPSASILPRMAGHHPPSGPRSSSSSATRFLHANADTCHYLLCL